MGFSIGCGKMEEWKVCGIPRPISTIQQLGREEEDKRDGGFRVGQKKLETDIHDDSNVDIIDIRRLRESIDHLEGNTKGGTICTAYTIFITGWAIGSTILLAMTYITLLKVQSVLENLVQ